MSSSAHIASKTGIFPAPEGGAVMAASLRLKETGYLGAKERIVLFNTGSGYNTRKQYKNFQVSKKLYPVNLTDYFQ